ncbi:MAG: hypothetical protein H8D62_01710 [Bacteroidetes bacterium]|nr:hypothetical protein [Bacteroidota bacterium]
MRKRHIVMLVAIVSVLLLPLIGMQFSNEVHWTLMDFIVAGGLLTIFALLIELIICKTQQGKQRTILILLITLALLLLWAEMAVGIFGTVISGS